MSLQLAVRSQAYYLKPSVFKFLVYVLSKSMSFDDMHKNDMPRIMLFMAQPSHELRTLQSKALSTIKWVTNPYFYRGVPHGKRSVVGIRGTAGGGTPVLINTHSPLRIAPYTHWRGRHPIYSARDSRSSQARRIRIWCKSFGTLCILKQDFCIGFVYAIDNYDTKAKKCRNF